MRRSYQRIDGRSRVQQAPYSLLVLCPFFLQIQTHVTCVDLASHQTSESAAACPAAAPTYNIRLCLPIALSILTRVKWGNVHKWCLSSRIITKLNTIQINVRAATGLSRRNWSIRPVAARTFIRMVLSRGRQFRRPFWWAKCTGEYAPKWNGHDWCTVG